MGQDFSLQLRQQNLMTKIMLKNEQQIIQHIQEEKIQLNKPINQMGDTLLHYACYKSLLKIIEYLLQKQGDPFILNNRGLSAVDVAAPEIRQQIYMKYKQIKQSQQMLQSKTIKLDLNREKLTK